MKTRNHFFLILLAAGTGFSANAASLAIDWFTLNGGGGTSINNTPNNTLSVSGTIGQPYAGKLSGGTLAIEAGYWGFITSPDAPQLIITRTDTNTVVVSWSSSLTAFSLEQNEDLGAPNWIASSERIEVTDDGRWKFIVVNPPPGNRFYRLHRTILIDTFDLNGGFHPQNRQSAAGWQLELGRSR